MLRLKSTGLLLLLSAQDEHAQGMFEQRHMLMSPGWLQVRRWLKVQKPAQRAKALFYMRLSKAGPRSTLASNSVHNGNGVHLHHSS